MRKTFRSVFASTLGLFMRFLVIYLWEILCRPTIMQPITIFMHGELYFLDNFTGSLNLVL